MSVLRHRLHCQLKRCTDLYDQMTKFSLLAITLQNFHAQLWTSEGKGWSRASASKLHCQTEGLRDQYVDALLQGRHQLLYDFDDHLNDIAK